MAHATSQGAPQEPRGCLTMVVPARGSLVVPFRELQPSLRQLRRIYRGTRAVLMGEEVARDPARSPRPVAHHHTPHRAECAPHTLAGGDLAGGEPPRRRHLSDVHALAGLWVRDPCTICPGKTRLMQELSGSCADLAASATRKMPLPLRISRSAIYWWSLSWNVRRVVGRSPVSRSR